MTTIAALTADTLPSPPGPFLATEFGEVSSDLSFTVDAGWSIAPPLAPSPSPAPAAVRTPYCADLILEIAILHLSLADTQALQQAHEDVRAIGTPWHT